jgi:hypothetical protein
MRNAIFFVLVVLWSCSCKPKTTAIVAHDKATGRTSVSDRNALPATANDELVLSSFLLDDLLKFDSEAKLKEVFGKAVMHSRGAYPEGMGEYPNTLLYSGTNNRVEFVWDDTTRCSGLAYIELYGQHTAWKTQEGITLGTRLKELERLNGKPFTFFGFDWDYSGAASWEDGNLDARKVFVCLGYPPNADMTAFDGLIGDQEIKSDSKLAQKANPVVWKITMRR